jgi:tRNA A37 methylthiotransferase MiaB
MATFRVDFLGCKVSHADVQSVREALLADGHVERDD